MYTASATASRASEVAKAVEICDEIAVNFPHAFPSPPHPTLSLHLKPLSFPFISGDAGVFIWTRNERVIDRGGEFNRSALPSPLLRRTGRRAATAFCA